ncbi:MAG: hypothetical protein U0796_03245 [Gemmatales bacterium]
MEWIDYTTELLTRITPALFEWAMILLPLTIYLLWLGFEVGRKKQPMLLSGKTDAMLLFVALSGLLFLGPPTWLIARYATGGEGRYFLVYALYVLFILLCGWWWIRGRRQSLVIYNIDPAVFATLARPVFEGLGVPFQMTPGCLAFAGQQLVLELESTPSLYCVTVSWRGDATLWDKVEAQLREKLADIQTQRNPAGALIPLYAAMLLSFVSMSTVLFVWYLAFMF